MDVTFVTRRNCHLCATAWPMVEGRREIEVTVVDVDDEGLADVYGDRVPVILVDGVEVLSGRFDRAAVDRALAGR